MNKDTWTGDQNQPISYNKWAYANANPEMYTDPSGLCASNDTACVDKARYLYRDYGWYVDSSINEEEVEIILRAAKTISTIFDRFGGNGVARMRGSLSPVWITHANFIWSDVLKYHHVVAQTVYLVRGFNEDILIHEMGHVIDNLNGNSITASIFGGGPSDEMARSLGVDPTQCTFRFNCSKYGAFLLNAKSELPISDYALKGPSEDFAETFINLTKNRAIAVQKIPVRSKWMANFITNLSRTRDFYSGDVYPSIFVPEPVQTPKCDMTDFLATPKP